MTSFIGSKSRSSSTETLGAGLAAIDVVVALRMSSAKTSRCRFLLSTVVRVGYFKCKKSHCVLDFLVIPQGRHENLVTSNKNILGKQTAMCPTYC